VDAAGLPAASGVAVVSEELTDAVGAAPAIDCWSCAISVPSWPSYELTSHAPSRIAPSRASRTDSI
jgi:hypothetical protein